MVQLVERTEGLAANELALFLGHPFVEGRPRMDDSEMPQRETNDGMVMMRLWAGWAGAARSSCP